MTFASALVSTTSDATEAATARPATSKTIFVRRFIAGIQIHGRPRDQGLDMGLVALAMQNVHRSFMDFGPRDDAAALAATSGTRGMG
jgi:hypothetical protein